MVTAAATISQIRQPGQADLGAVKSRQQGAWSSGDYAIVGTTLQIVGESLCEAVDIRAGQKVLDVAAGNGNATLAAARRWAELVMMLTRLVPSWRMAEVTWRSRLTTFSSICWIMARSRKCTLRM